MFDLVFSNQPERAARISQQCRDARARGAPVYSRAPCQALSMDFKPDSAYPMLMVQPWTELKTCDHQGFVRGFFCRKPFAIGCATACPTAAPTWPSFATPASACISWVTRSESWAASTCRAGRCA